MHGTAASTVAGPLDEIVVTAQNTKFVSFTTFQAFNTPRTVGLNVRKEL